MGRAFPGKGLDKAGVRAYLSEARKGDVDWRAGKITGLVYFAGDDVVEVARDAYNMFFVENAIHPRAWPSLQRLESEVVGMTSELLHGGEGAAGSMTSGGTESIFLAVKAARDWTRANRPTAGTPEIVAPRTAHPAFDRAATYLGLNVTRVAEGADFRADVAAMANAVTQDTIMRIGSAPAYPHGVMDPIGELGELAQSEGLWLHADACLGGFAAPFVKKLGYPVPDFDFSVPGVTSISLDLHKNGYAMTKGASVVLYRDAEYFRHQGFEFDQWPRGQYSSKTFTGSRPGGAVAAAWAVMNYLGEEGYLRVAREVMQAKEAMIEGINGINGLQIWGDPELFIFTFGSRSLDIFAVADGFADTGWYVTRIQEPPGMHMMLSLVQVPLVEEFISDLSYVVERVRAGEIVARATAVSY